MYQNTINGCKILLQNEANAYKVYQKVKKDIKKEKNVFFVVDQTPCPSQQHCYVFPINFVPWRDWNPGLLCLRQMRGANTYICTYDFLFVAKTFRILLPIIRNAASRHAWHFASMSRAGH
jgi:hypothetical protein